MKAKGDFSSPRLKLIRPESTSMRVKRSGEGGGSGGPTGAAAPVGAEGRGSHSARFQSPFEARTRFRLGRLREKVPNSRRPRNRLRQRRRIVSDSARRKYSCPKRGSSPTVTDCASSVGQPHRLNS